MEDLVIQHLKTHEPAVLNGTKSITESPFFKGAPHEQFGVLFPVIKERFATEILTPEIIYEHIVQGGAKFPEPKIFEERLQELAKLKNIAVKLPQIDRGTAQSFVQALGNPYLIDCMTPGVDGRIHTGRVERLFSAYQDFIEKHPYYPPEVVSEGLKVLVDKVKDESPKERLDKTAPAMLSLYKIFSREQSNAINAFAFRRGAEMAAREFIESQNLPYTEAHQKIVADILKLYKPEPMTEEKWTYLKKVIVIGLELGAEYKTEDVLYLIKSAKGIDTAKANLDEVKENIIGTVSQDMGGRSNLFTRLESNPVTVIQRILIPIFEALMPERKKSQQLKRLNRALDDLREPLANSEIIKVALEAAGPGALFVKTAANLMGPAGENAEQFLTQLGLSINRDLETAKNEVATGISPKGKTFVAASLVPLLANQIKAAHESFEIGSEPNNPFQEVLTKNLPILVENMGWAKFAGKVLKKMGRVGTWVLGTGLVKGSLNKLISFGVDKGLELSKEKLGAVGVEVKAEEKAIIKGSAGVIVEVMAPVVEEFLTTHDLTPYADILVKLNALIQSREPWTPVDDAKLNVVCLELFQAIYKDIVVNYKDLIVDVLKEISKAETTPLGESQQLVA